MNDLLYNKIKKIEYVFFIKKIKEALLIKKAIKTKIISFQKRFGLEQLLINVIHEMKNDILKRKLRKFLIKKFLFRIMERYITHYKNDKNYDYDEIDKNDKMIEKSKKLFKDYLLKANIYTFLNGANICIFNRRLKYIQYEYSIINRINKTKICFMKIKELNNNSFSKNKKIIMCKKFFIEIKKQILYNQKYIKQKRELEIKKNIFIYKNKYKYIDNEKNKFNVEKENNNLYDDSIKNKIKEKYVKYFRIFIRRVKIIKQANYALKRKIFNLIKNNAKFSKDLKYYLKEATKEMKNL